MVDNIPQIQSACAEEYEAGLAARDSSEVRHAEKNARLCNAVQTALQTIVAAMFTAGIYKCPGDMVRKSLLTQADFMQLMSVQGTVVSMSLGLSDQIKLISTGRQDCRSYLNALGSAVTKHESVAGDKAVLEGEVKIEGLAFGYSKDN